MVAWIVLIVTGVIIGAVALAGLATWVKECLRGDYEAVLSAQIVCSIVVVAAFIWALGTVLS